MYKHFMGSLLIICAFTVGQVYAVSHEHCRARLHHLIQSLDLNQTQKTKIDGILAGMKTQIKEIAPHLRTLKGQLRQQILSSHMNKKETHRIIHEKTKLIGELMEVKVQAKHEIYQVLNDQQKAKLKAKLDKEEKRMEHVFKRCHKED